MTFSLDYSCRICLSNNALVNVCLTKRRHNSSLVACDEMVSAVFSFTIAQDDGLPSKICRKCFSKLFSAYKLKKTAEASQEILSEFFSSSTSTKAFQNIVKDEIKIECFKIKEELEEKLLNEELNELKSELESDNAADSLNLEEEANCEGLDYDFSFENESLSETLLFVGGNENHSTEDFNKKEKGMPVKETRTKRKTSIKCKKKLKIEKKSLKPKKGHLNREPRLCPLCGKQVMDMEAHSETHKPASEKRKLPCKQCPKVFVSQSSRRKHVLVHHLGRLFFCKICDKHFKHGDQHVRMVHTVRPKPLCCPLCDKRFFTKAPLDIHLTSHTKERAFPCSVCGKGFRTHTDSEIHRRSVHEKERNVICQFCPKGFFSNADLNKHLCSHTKDKKYKCSKCDKCFSRSNQLKLHLQRHAGIKNIQCTLCDKAFYTVGNLQTHMISHTKEKNYPCKYCGVKFGRTHHRDRHQKTAHENKLEKEAILNSEKIE